MLANQGNGFPRAGSLTFFLAGSGDWSPCARSLTFSPRIVAGRVVEFSLSCHNDVGDVGVANLEEPMDNTLGQRVARGFLCNIESFLKILDDVW